MNVKYDNADMWYDEGETGALGKGHHWFLCLNGPDDIRDLLNT